jgi:hypothetical protein
VLLLAFVLLAGILAGLAMGGSIRRLGDLSFRWWPLALVGLALQFVPVPGSGAAARAWGAALLVVSFVCLTVFVAMNLRIPGMPLMAAGFVLNIVAIAANGGMPVTDHAMRVAYGADYPRQRAELVAGGGAKHHLADASDHLIVIADVIGVPAPVRLIVSAGDVLSFAGAAWVLAAATLGRASRPARTPPGGLEAGRTPPA